MSYYHLGISYLFAITYYYSVLDILLSQILYQSFTAISIVSSLAKLTPQFLGQLCFVENMSGIDQQFIHYAHPLAVLVILALVYQSARISHKFLSLKYCHGRHLPYCGWSTTFIATRAIP